MTDTSVDYQKALETVGNSYSPAIGFSATEKASQQGDRIMIAQNDVIIELLISLNQKLNLLSSTVSNSSTVIPASLESQISSINKSLATLRIQEPKGKTVKSPSNQIAVWIDPKTLIKK